MKIKKHLNRFVLLDDDDSPMGQIVFKENEEGFIEAKETYVDNKYRGQGLAKILVDMLVAQARLDKKKIIPLCSYVLKVFTENKEYEDVWKKR